MLSTPPNSNDAALYAYAEAQLLIYPNAIGGAWPELSENLTAIMVDRVARLPFVPADWIDDVKIIVGRGFAPVLISPYDTKGNTKSNLPAWMQNLDKSALDAWNTIATATKNAVMDYSQGQIDSGRDEMAKLYADVAFWDTMYNVAKAVADIPQNLVGGALDGIQSVTGGVLKKLFSSWIVWVALVGAGGFFAWRVGLLKFKGKSDA